jgi:hypothetical protein
MFDGRRLIPPGVVPAWQWHPEPNEASRTEIILGGVGVKDA